MKKLVVPPQADERLHLLNLAPGVVSWLVHTGNEPLHRSVVDVIPPQHLPVV